ncbi:hypothetical protein Pmani_023998 [Petrolisthes manimaculis]|uniref:Mediator of RNA polymerase II transcription subunit 26 n=1 Tax=Petrolisthes manimaculis TaxID=1843537 RepID=A0AAE1PA42_9EUCA|nr:hypothetical protein Pmani_023998 [Petrolisthes manimaculis]
MQRSIEDIKSGLLTCTDPEYNVTDMATCLELISKLERTPITKEVLESTRLGRLINNIRRKTGHHELYRRSKDLVRKWRKEVLAEGVNGAAGPGGTGPGGTGGKGTGNGHPLPPNSPSSLPSSGNTSPGLLSAPSTPSTLVQRTRTASPTLTTAHTSLTTAHSTRPLKPMSPALMRGRVLSPGLSPALASVSPAITPPLPTPARPRSRPQSPATNPTMRQPPRADASSYAPSTENVAKTNTANKRLRKDEDDSSEIPVAKRPRNNVTNGFDEDSRDSFSSGISNEFTKGTSDSKSKRTGNTHTLTKRRQNVMDTPHTTSTADQLQQKMAALPLTTKASKVKTTSQIVAELAERKGDSKLAERATKLEEQHVRELASPASTLGMGRTVDSAVVTRNKMDHLQRFLSSQPSPASDALSRGDDDDDEDRGSLSSETEERRSPSVSASPHPQVSHINPMPVTPSNLDLLGVMSYETAEEILARLPPLDASNIVWEDPEEQVDEAQEQEERSGDTGSEESGSEDETERLMRQSEKVPREKIDVLHSNNLDCQNGNFDVDGKFREWHEVIVKKGYQDDPLIVLPYVITDF